MLVGFNGFSLFFGVFFALGLSDFVFLGFWLLHFGSVSLLAFTGSCFLFSSSLLLSRTLLRLLNLMIIGVVVVVVVDVVVDVCVGKVPKFF